MSDPNRVLLEEAISKLEAAYVHHQERHPNRPISDLCDINGHPVYMGHLSAIVIGRAALERS